MNEFAGRIEAMMKESFAPELCLDAGQIDGLLSRNGNFAHVNSDGFAVWESVGADAYLLAWLGVSPSARGKGLGRKLFGSGVAGCRTRKPGCYILLELHHPDFAEPEFGDPQRRIAFYERLGVKLLDVPYVMPTVAKGSPQRHDHVVGCLTATAETTGVMKRSVERFLSAAEDDGSTRFAALSELSDTRVLRLVPLGEVNTDGEESLWARGLS